MTIKLFLASSSELKKERDEFEKFIRRKNDEWQNKNIYLKLNIWEDFIDSVSQSSLQNEYNKAVRDSDIFIMLFFTKVGKYTQSEFESAFGQFKKTNKPIIYTYFKNDYIKTGDIIREDILSLLDFKQKISELGHYLTYYSNIEDLLHKFNNQLSKLSEKYNWENNPGGHFANGSGFDRIHHLIDQGQLPDSMLELRELIKRNLEELAIRNDFKLTIKAPMHVLHDLGKMNVLSKEGLGRLEYALSVTDKSYNNIKVSKDEAQRALKTAEEGFDIVYAEKGTVTDQGGDGYFHLKTDASGRYYFSLVSEQKGILLKGEPFMSKASLMNCIESVRMNSRNESMFREKTSKKGDLFFLLLAKNGQVIGTSNMFSSKQLMENAINKTIQIAKSASVVDNTGQ